MVIRTSLIKSNFFDLINIVNQFNLDIINLHVMRNGNLIYTKYYFIFPLNI